jgi:hypothetical protein
VGDLLGGLDDLLHDAKLGAHRIRQLVAILVERVDDLFGAAQPGLRLGQLPGLHLGQLAEGVEDREEDRVQVLRQRRAVAVPHLADGPEQDRRLHGGAPRAGQPVEQGPDGDHGDEGDPALGPGLGDPGQEHHHRRDAQNHQEGADLPL